MKFSIPERGIEGEGDGLPRLLQGKTLSKPPASAD